MSAYSTRSEQSAYLLLLLLLIPLVFSVLIRSVLPTPHVELRRVLVCGLELLFILPYLAMVPARTRVMSFRWPLLIGVGLWLIATVVSIALSSHPLPSAIRQAEWFCHLLFGVTVWHFVRNNGWAARWVLSFVVAGVVLTVVFVGLAWHSANDPSSVNWYRSIPMFGHIRHFGYYVVAGLMAAHLVLLSERRRWTGLLIAVPLMILLWASLIWTGGRGAFGAAVFGVVFLVIAARPKARWSVIGVNTIGVSVGSVIATVYAAGQSMLGPLHIFSRVSPDANSWSTGRSKMWNLVFEHFLERPWFGYGADAYVFFHPKGYGVQPHGFVPQFLSDWGAVGSALAVLLVAAAVGIAVRRLSGRAGDERGAQAAGLALVVAMLAHGVIDGTLYHALSLMLLFVGLAVALAPIPFTALMPDSLRTGGGGQVAVLRTAAWTIAVVFLVHGLVLTNLVVPVTPPADSFRARFVRLVPTTTFNLQMWIKDWATEDPDVAIEWAHWAHDRSPDAYVFGSLEAQLLAERGLYQAARDHAVYAINTSPGMQREAVTYALSPIIEMGDAYSDQMLFQVDE